MSPVGPVDGAGSDSSPSRRISFKTGESMRKRSQRSWNQWASASARSPGPTSSTTSSFAADCPPNPALVKLALPIHARRSAMPPARSSNRYGLGWKRRSPFGTILRSPPGIPFSSLKASGCVALPDIPTIARTSRRPGRRRRARSHRRRRAHGERSPLAMSLPPVVAGERCREARPSQTRDHPNRGEIRISPNLAHGPLTPPSPSAPRHRPPGCPVSP